MDNLTCKVYGCDQPSKTRGYCSRHYQKLWRYGDTGGGLQDPTDCARCGETIPPKQNPHGPGATYCSTRCRTAASYERRKAAGLITHKALPKKIVSCAVCEAEFEARRSDSRCCSKTCSRKFHRKPSLTMCSVDGCGKPMVAREMCSTHYNLNSPNRSSWSKGKPETRRRSNRVWTAKRRALTRGADAENVDREAVGERDGWRCGICAKRIDPELVWPAPKSQSLDHIVPLSLGGQHTYLNTRIAHLDCNVRRSNKPEADQMILFG